MPIAPGDRLPDATFATPGPDGPKQVTTAELFDGKTVVLFAVPGAFTPTCHLQHAPGFIAKAAEIKAKGADVIACLAVNDPFVLGAWAKSLGAGDAVTFLADGSANFTKAIGMELDAAAFGMGVRAKRFAMIVKDRIVQKISTEDNPGAHDVSSAEKALEALEALD